MARLSLENLKEALSTYVASNKIDLSSLSVTTDNIVGLVDTIGKIYTIDTNVYDKLPELDGGTLSFGKTVEEWQQDMTLPVDFDVDSDGNKALKDYSPTYRPVSFSITLGRKIFATSIPYGNIERAVHNEDQFIQVVAMITKKLEDSVALWKYGAKREAIGKFIDKCETAISGATALSDGDDIVVGSYYSNGGKNYVAMVSEENVASISDAIDDGKLVELQFIKTASLPTDTATGEAFIQAVKEAVEKAQDVSEGYSLNGNVLGVEEGLALYVKQGVMPSVEVSTLSGAFHEEQLSMNVVAKVIKDFGSTNSNAFAVLMDSRAVRLFEGYNSSRSNENGYGDRVNIFRHVEYTAHVSRNAFICVFEPAGA